jgi:NAD(P)-dependent dehydrogenase (short-subunit alcohol dehydrogenase family)
MSLLEAGSQGKLLSGKTALVTGAARRIGRCVALTLANAGANVAITYRNSRQDAFRTVEELQKLDVRADALSCDVRSESSVQAAVNETVRRYGQLDLLVNNAGIFETKALESVTTAEWDAMFETNTRGPFLMARTAHPFLKAAQGRIINLGSLGGMHPWATHGHYCASKAALHMLTQIMAKAFAPEISVNCVAPGMIVDGEVDATYEHFAAKTPMRRNGVADEVAAAVLFFAVGPHFITGQILAVDGGLGL